MRPPSSRTRDESIARILASVEDMHQVLEVKITREGPGLWTMDADEIDDGADLVAHYMALVRAEPEATYAGLGAQEAIRRDVESHTRRVRLGLCILGEAIRELATVVEGEPDGEKEESPAGEPLLTADDLGELLGVGRRSIYNMMSEAPIPGALKIGRRLRFDPVVVREWIATLPHSRGRHPFAKKPAR